MFSPCGKCRILCAQISVQKKRDMTTRRVCFLEPVRLDDGSPAFISVWKNVGRIDITDVHSVGISIGDSVDGQPVREELSP